MAEGYSSHHMPTHTSLVLQERPSSLQMTDNSFLSSQNSVSGSTQPIKPTGRSSITGLEAHRETGDFGGVVDGQVGGCWGEEVGVVCTVEGQAGWQGALALRAGISRWGILAVGRAEVPLTSKPLAASLAATAPDGTYGE